ncbi:MAG: Na/Pi cotransporter family protein [Eubacteriales bacterium]|nr:Na/Pi cotransporter family protein [Eubacteriales bacterium]
MDLFSVLELIGGLVLFLFGMSYMGNALEKRAGNQLKALLSNLTKNPLRGYLLGLGVTAVIQSSSATTVMVVGFVNSGLMTLAQAIYIIMGANVGTSVTSWVLSLTGIESGNFFVQLLKPMSFTPILALAGIAMYMGSKKDRSRDTGSILIGFAVLMYGMDIMSGAVKPLADVPQFTSILTMFSNPLLGVLAGAVLTGVIQSSSASVGILQALSMTGSVSWATSIPIVMGQNIGTCVTALLSSVGASAEARRASMVHLYFNVIGTVVWLAIYSLLRALIPMPFLEEAISPLGIAILHTGFNVLCSVLLAPFGRQLGALATKTIHSKEKHEELNMLDDRLFVTPPVAVQMASQTVKTMAETATEAIQKALGLVDVFTEEGLAEVCEMEDKLDVYEDKIGTYLVKLSACDNSEEDSHEITKLLHLIGNFERIGDHAVSIAKSAQEMYDKRQNFSAEARKEIAVLRGAVYEIVRISLEAFVNNDITLAAHIEPLEQVIDRLSVDIKANHIARLTAGDCTIELGFVLSDLLGDLERVSDHCSNIGVCVIEIAQNAMDVHEYLHDIKYGGGQNFNTLYEGYAHRFRLSEAK